MKTARTLLTLCMVPLLCCATETKPVTPPTQDALRNMTADQLIDTNELSSYVFAVIENAPGASFDQKSKHALENILPESAANYYLVTTFIGMWGNGGMQHVLLCEPDELAHKKWELESTVRAFASFGCNRTAAFIKDLIPKSAQWSKAIAALNAREDRGEAVPEEEFDKIWGEVDKYDDPFDEGFPEDPDVYEVMLKDINKNPENFVKK